MTSECNRFICFDLETTGLSVKTAEIIEISAIKMEDWEMSDCFNTFVKPSKPIPYEITELTGITNADVANAPEISEILPEFLKFIDDEILLGHNISCYDLPILRRIAEELHFSIPDIYIDTVQIARRVLPELPNHKLETLCQYYNVKNDEAHRAMSDAMATARVYEKLVTNAAGDLKNITVKDDSSSKKRNTFRKAFSEQTQALITLKGIIAGITCDNVLTEAEVYYLKDWLNQNSELSGNYPFDIALREVNAALEDGILEQSELDHMLGIFKEFLDPVEANAENAQSLNFCGKTVCLSGDFETGSKNDISQRLISLGAEIKDTVTRAVDYLIVGEMGSSAWTCGNYGTKVKKALEMQEKGHPIKILKESEVFVPSKV